MHILKFVALYGVLLTAGVTTAANAHADTWSCALSVALRGVSQHFFYYGRDSWAGETVVMCKNGERRVARRVEVNFNSAFDGYGADRGSTARLRLKVITPMPPEGFQVLSDINAWEDTEKLLAKVTSGVTTGVATFDRFDPASASRSLSRGRLFIRVAANPEP